MTTLAIFVDLDHAGHVERWRPTDGIGAPDPSIDGSSGT
jgi:hypothetical protein